jgi:DNA-binding MurR/RpiR family transcriptional regulator
MANQADQMTPPSDVHDLRERLRRDYEAFSPAQKALARYMADHLADLPLMSAHEVARAAHCSPATVVRFAQALGYGGYPEMQLLVRRAQRPWLPADRNATGIGLVPPADGLAAHLAAERHALDDAADRLGPRGLAPLANALGACRPLVLAGDGHARPVLSVLHQRLSSSGRPVVTIDALEACDRAWLDGMPPSGGVLAIAIGRDARIAEAAVDAARQAGLPVAALVDSSLSPLARLALSRVVPADVRGGSPSLVAMVAIAQALCSALEVRSHRVAVAVA